MYIYVYVCMYVIYNFFSDLGIIILKIKKKKNQLKNDSKKRF